MEKEVAFLTLTIAVELPVAMFVLGKQDWQRIVGVVICINLITHPIAWHFAAEGTSILLLEGIVMLLEALILAATLSPYRSRAFLAGCSMNILSATIGVLFF